MSHNDQLAQLQSLFEGKSVLKVESPNASEAIAKFVMADGSAFILHATDLGWWIAETKGNGDYTSLNTLITDYYNHAYLHHLNNNAAIVVDNNIVVFYAPDEKEFRGDVSKFSEFEKRVVAHPKGIKLLEEHGVHMGDMWRVVFTLRYTSDIPPELIDPQTLLQ
jgi:hypothetical protein